VEYDARWDCCACCQRMLNELADLRQRFSTAERTVIWSRLKEELDLRRIQRAADKWCVRTLACVDGRRGASAAVCWCCLRLVQVKLAGSRRLPLRKVKALIDAEESLGVDVSAEV
jgi:hypothetical protein